MLSILRGTCIPRAARRIGLTGALAVVATFATESATAATRWDASPYSPAHPIVMQGSLVVHDDGFDVRAFSATAQRFFKIAPGGAQILGSGDNLVLVRFGSTVRAWSARTNTTADVTFGQFPFAYSAVGDDVALVVYSSSSGATIAYAYSAVSNQWKSIGGTLSGSPAANSAVSRFVIALKLTAGMYGFSARKGEWVLLPNSQPAAAPKADGNVALTTYPLASGPTVAAAFSGVLGNWAVTKPLVPNTEVKFDHNVAIARTDAGPVDWSAQGYSAYNGLWVTSQVKHKLTNPLTIYISDNVVAITNAYDSTPGIEAYGARPGVAFTFLPTTTGGIYSPMGADYLICEPTSGVNTAMVFSGVAGASFIPYSYTYCFAGGFGGGHQFLAVDLGNRMIGYSAARHAFADIAVSPAFDSESMAALGEYREYQATGARFHAFAGRHGHFTSSPVQEAGATFDTVTAGSLIARRQVDGVGAGGILVFDERCDRYPKMYKPGGTTTMKAGNNVLLVQRVTSPYTVSGYSVARADWKISPSVAAGAPLVPPQAEDNVGYFVDGDGKLFAFGGDGDLHAFYSYPNDTEFQTFGLQFGQVSISPAAAILAFAGEPGDTADQMQSLGFQWPGTPVPGFANPLCLDPASLSITGPIGVIGAPRVRTLSVSAGTLGSPAVLQIWFQERLNGGPSGNWIGQRCEGVWFL